MLSLTLAFCIISTIKKISTNATYLDCNQQIKMQILQNIIDNL
jgi:hypothetical protein